MSMAATWAALRCSVLAMRRNAASVESSSRRAMTCFSLAIDCPACERGVFGVD